MAYHRTAHSVYDLNDHLVWPPKYRKHLGTLAVKQFEDRGQQFKLF